MSWHACSLGKPASIDVVGSHVEATNRAMTKKNPLVERIQRSIFRSKCYRACAPLLLPSVFGPLVLRRLSPCSNQKSCHSTVTPQSRRQSPISNTTERYVPDRTLLGIFPIVKRLLINRRFGDKHHRRRKMATNS